MQCRESRDAFLFLKKNLSSKCIIIVSFLKKSDDFLMLKVKKMSSQNLRVKLFSTFDKNYGSSLIKVKCHLLLLATSTFTNLSTVSFK